MNKLLLLEAVKTRECKALTQAAAQCCSYEGSFLQRQVNPPA